MLVVGMVASVTINQISAASPAFPALVPSPANMMTSIKGDLCRNRGGLRCPFALLWIQMAPGVDCNIIDACKHAEVVLASWRRFNLSVAVKAHLCESHAVEQMFDLVESTTLPKTTLNKPFIRENTMSDAPMGSTTEASKAANAHSKWEPLRMDPLVTKKAGDGAAEARKRKVYITSTGRMAKQARDKLALNTKTVQRAALREDD